MSNEPTDKSTTTVIVTKPKKKRRLLKFAIICFVLLIAFVLMLPTLISTGPGTSFVLSFVNKSIPGKVEINNLDVGWFSGTKVEGLTVKDPDGATFLVANLDAPDLALLAAIRGNMALGTVTIDASQCDIIQYEDGTTNLDRAFGPSKEKPKDDAPASMPANMSAKLRLTAREVTYSAPNMDKAIVSDLDMQADVDSPQAISAVIKAKVTQGTSSGTIDGSAKLTDAFDAAGVMQVGKADVDATFTLANLPTAMIGALAKQGDKITTLAGPDVTTKVSAKGKLSDLTVDLSVVAERLKIGATTQVALGDDYQWKTIKPVTGQLAWVKITPASHAAFAAGAGRLVEPFEVTVTHENVSLTNTADGPDMLTATAGLNIKVTPIKIDTGTAGESDIKELNITAMRLAYDGPKGVATALIEAVARQGADSGTFTVAVDLNKPLDARGNINYKTLDGTIDGRVKDFALGVVDDLIGTQGLLTSVLGDTLNATALMKVKPTADGKGGSGTLALTATSANKLDVNLKANITADPIANPVKDGPTFAASAALSEPGTVKLYGAQRTLTTLAQRYPGLKDLAAKLKADDAADITLTINQLAAPLDGTLMKRAQAQMALNIGGASFDLNAAGQNNADLLVKINGATATLDYSGAKNQAIITADARTTVTNKPGQLTANITVNNLLDAQGKVDAAALAPVIVADLVDMPTALADAFIAKGRLAHYGIGPVLNAKVTTTITQVAGSGDNQSTVEGPVRIIAKADNLDVLIDGRLRGGRFELPEPGKSHVTMIATAALMEDMKQHMLSLPDDFKNVTLDQPAKLHITFTQLDVPLDAEQAKKTGRFGFTATIDQIMPKGDARLQGASVRNLIATLKPTTLEQPINISIKGDLVQVGPAGPVTGKIDATANVTNAMADNRRISASATITKIPTALVDTLGGQGGLLIELFGTTIEKIGLSLKPGEGAAMIAGYDLQSQLATGTGGITLVPDQSATFAANSKLIVQLSPQGFARIQSRYGDSLPAMLKDVVLVEAAMFDVTIERAQFALAPLPAEAAPTATTTTRPTQAGGAGGAAAATPPAAPAKPLPINAKNSSFKINIKTKGPFIGKRDFASSLRLDNVNLDVFTPQNMGEITIDLKADTAVIPMVNNAPQLANEQAIEKGNLTAVVTAKNLGDKDGRVSFANVGLESLAVNVQGRKLPVHVVDNLLALNGKATGVLGAIIDELTVTSRRDGDLVADLKSPKAKIKVTGLYTDRLSLTEDASAALHMDEILSSLFFEPLTGGILRAERSEKPVTIVVQKDGFSAPASGFDVANMTAKIDFDFNSMKLKPLISVDNLVPAQFKPLMAAAGVGGLLESELGAFLGKFDEYMPTFDKFSASIENGTLRYSKPMTFTVDKFTVALDGTVNLKTKVPQLNFGFPKAALSGKLQKFLGSEGYLYVPFTHKDGKLVPDVSKFADTTLKSAFSPANLIPGIPGLPGTPGTPGAKPGDKPDIGGIIGGILGGTKKDDKKDDKKGDMKDKEVPAPQTPAPPAPPKAPDSTIPAPPAPTTPTTPAPPAPTTPTPPAPEKKPEPAAEVDPIKAEVAAIIALSGDRAKFVPKINEIAKVPKTSSLHILAQAMHELQPNNKPNLLRLDTSQPKWFTYDKLKRVVKSDAFDRLCTNYLAAAALGAGSDIAHAAIVKWLKDNESKLTWNESRSRWE